MQCKLNKKKKKKDKVEIPRTTEVLTAEIMIMEYLWAE